MGFNRILLLLILFSHATYAQPSGAHSDPSHDALAFVSLNWTPINAILSSDFHLDPALAIAIAMPEIGRFSALRNNIETSALQVFYIQLGKDYANFSIGRLQMKPSFAEQLDHAAHYDLKDFAYMFAYQSPDSIAIRTERVDRLSQLEWQLRYLGLFCKLVERKFNAPLTIHSLSLYAGAYNLGWRNTEETICKWNAVRNFPSGKRKDSDSSYAAVSRERYDSLKTLTPHD